MKTSNAGQSPIQTDTGKATSTVMAGTATNAAAAEALPRKVVSKVTVFIISAFVIAACAAIAAGALLVAPASADIDTMTSTIDSENQQAFIDLAQAELQEDIAQTQAQQAEDQGTQAQQMTGQVEQPSEYIAEGDSQSTGVNASGSPADDCVVTINYLEYADYEDPDAEFDDMGRRILGKRVLTGLHEGDVLNAWNYVVNIPGHFFFDGWPLNLTVTTDPSKNTFDLIYIKLHQAEFTVNYYVMLNADLDADTWTDALAPDDVEFVKLGSQTFTNQRTDQLVKGDAYEYKLDDMYVIDTYPPEIRLGTDPDNNVINVLYTPSLANLPDNIEVPDGVVPPESVPPDGSTPSLPGDGSFDEDDITTTLPGGTVTGPVDDVFEDFVGSDIDRGEMNVTDDMLANPVGEKQANYLLDIYQTGLQTGKLAQTGDDKAILIWVLVGIAIVAVAGGLTAAYVAHRRKSQS